jgi:hypothetical protein
MIRTPRPRALVRRRFADQGGYALIAALAAMLVCTILTAALLGLTTDTNRIEQSGRVRERQIRAAEGGIEAAINQLRNAQAVAAPKPWVRGQPLAILTQAQIGGCADLMDAPLDPSDPPPEGTTQLAPLLTIDEVPVRVECTDQGGYPLSPPPAGEPDQWIPADNGGPSLRLVGADGYTRNWVDKTTMPWAAALGTSYYSSEITGSKASLVHTGKAPLRIVGGLEARNQVVALRNPLTAKVAGPSADAELQPYGEAVEVTGYAQQGGGGLYANSTGGTGCGVASPANIWGVQSSMVTSSSSVDTSTSGFSCGNSAFADGTGLGLLFPGSGDWTNADVNSVRNSQRDGDAFAGRGLPTNCSALKSNGVVNLSAYTVYDRDDTAILNQWFVRDGVNDCTDTTFYFGPGDFWFDAWDPGNSNPDLRSTLRFDDYSSDWVFGDALLTGPNGWNPTSGRPSKAAFPKVCDTDKMGANIVLSSRTGLWHSSGRVAICGPRPPVTTGTNYNAPSGAPVHTTAIWQRTSTAMGDRLAADSPSSASGWSVTGNFATALRNQDGNRVGTSVTVPPVVYFDGNFPYIHFRNACWTFGNCGQVTRTFTASNFLNLNGVNPGSETIDNAYIDLTGNAAWANGSGARIVFTVALTGGGSCSLEVAGLPTNFVTKSYTLRDGANGPCAGVINNRSQLRGANITVAVTMNNPALGLNNPGAMSFEIDSLQLRTTWRPRVANSVTSPSGSGVAGFQAFTSPTLARVAGDGVAQARRSCTETLFNWLCTRVEWYESRLDFKFEDSQLLDGFLPLTSASVDIDMTRVHSMWSAGGPNYDKRLVLTLTTPSGETCTVDRTRDQLIAALPATSTGADGRVVGSGKVSLDLLGGTGPCNGLRTGDLVNSSVSLLLRASNECYTTCNFGWDVDAITLKATASGYSKPETPFRVRWNPYKQGNTTPGDPGEPGDALFNVVGSTSITTNDVEVDFDGGGRPVGQPIFVGGNNNPGLVAATLASKAVDGAWPNPWTKADSDRLPDPVSSNGSIRPPVRRVLLTACVVENADRAVNQHELVRRVQVEVDVRDDAKSGGAIDIGREVQVRRWKVLGGSSPIATGAAASTQDCSPTGEW